MKHNTMKKLTEEPLQEINIKQTCICEGINRMAKRVKYIETIVKEGDKILLYSKKEVELYKNSYIKKALDLLLGNKET